jgi:hypothetical protein
VACCLAVSLHGSCSPPAGWSRFKPAGSNFVTTPTLMQPTQRANVETNLSVKNNIPANLNHMPGCLSMLRFENSLANLEINFVLAVTILSSSQGKF